MPLTVGTAGHVDHGKTWLVRALTGKDTDRLPEEQQRGISIDLGYAPLELPDGRRLSLVDVPGHERFVRNMVAGATGIDLFLLVIDAARGRAAADARAPRDPPAARDRARRRRGDEGRRCRRGDARARGRGGARARARGRGRRRQREDRRGARRAARGARARRPANATARDGPTRLTSTACSRCAGSARSSPARSGRERWARATSCASSRRGSTSASAASRCTTARSIGRRRANGSRLRSPGSSATGCARRRARRARRLPHHLPPRRRARGARRRAGGAAPSISARPTCRRGSPATARYAQLRLERPVVAARGDRVVLRAADNSRRRHRPRPAPAAPSRPRAARAARSWRARSDRARTRARDSLRHLGDAERASSAPATGSSRREWLEELRANVARAARGTPTRATRESTPRPLRGRPRSCRCSALERRGSRLYLPGRGRAGRKAARSCSPSSPPPGRTR